MRRICVWVLLFVALSARADIYRCLDSDGQLRFTDDASHCQRAEPLQIERKGKPACTAPSDCALPAAISPNSRSVDRAGLAPLFVPLRELGTEWRLVDDAPEPIDPELRRAGLSDTSTRHYARSRPGVSQVCSIELWKFERAGTAGAVERSLEMPNWQVLRADALLVLAHGIRLELGAGSDGRLDAACAELGRLTHRRIADRRP